MALPAGSRALRPLLLADDVLAYRYRLVRPVDVPPERSGPAVVWLATDEVLARPVAVKLISAAGRRGAAASDSFLAAAARAGTVAHPVLARVYDAALEERPAERAGQPAGEIDVAYVISEWVDGRTLAEVVAADGPWEPAEACGLVTEIADALCVAHDAGIPHGRIHPHNVLLARGGRVKLTDLAVSAALPQHAVPALRATDPTPTGADVRDITAVLYALLTARWPASATPQPSCGIRPAPSGKDGPARGKLTSPRQIRAGIPRSLDSVIVRALDPVAAQTPPALTTPAALCDALERAVLPSVAGRNGLTGSTRIVPRPGTRPAARTAGPPVPPPPARPAPPAARPAARPVGAAPLPPRAAAAAAGTPRAFLATPPAPLRVPAAPPRTSTPRSPAPNPTVPPELLRWLPLVLSVVLLVVVGSMAYSTGKRIGTVSTSPDSVAASRTPVGGPAAGNRGPAGMALRLTSVPVQDFDPPPGDGREQPGAVSNAHDEDRSTVWMTDAYDSENYGGVKQGVGLVVDLGQAQALSRVELDVTAPGTSVELRGADVAGMDPSAFRTLARGRSGAGPLTLSTSSAAPARYYLIWITGLPKVGPRFSTGISEMRFFAR